MTLRHRHSRALRKTGRHSNAYTRMTSSCALQIVPTASRLKFPVCLHTLQGPLEYKRVTYDRLLSANRGLLSVCIVMTLYPDDKIRYNANSTVLTHRLGAVP